MRIRGADPLALCLLFVLCSVPIRAVEEGFTLSKGKAGAIHAGMTIDELYAQVGRNNARLVDRYSEGFFSPAIEIYLGPKGIMKPLLLAQIVGQNSGFVVGRITVYDSRFKTDAGIGVGSTLGEVRRNYRLDWIGFGEGPLVVRVEQIGMSFALDYVNPSREWGRTHNQTLIPDSAKVVSVFLADGTRPWTKP